jgi:hypothetical protein
MAQSLRAARGDTSLGKQTERDAMNREIAGKKGGNRRWTSRLREWGHLANCQLSLRESTCFCGAKADTTPFVNLPRFPLVEYSA